MRPLLPTEADLRRMVVIWIGGLGSGIATMDLVAVRLLRRDPPGEMTMSTIPTAQRRERRAPLPSELVSLGMQGTSIAMVTEWVASEAR